MNITPEMAIAAARKFWPEASGFKLESPCTIWSEDLGVVTTRWKLTRYTIDCDGDELGSYFTGYNIPDLLTRIGIKI